MRIEEDVKLDFKDVLFKPKRSKLESRRKSNFKFMHISTDEVFGPAPKDVNYKERDRYNSTNPYSDTKAGGEELSVAF